MACACALVAFGGFVPSYWLPVASGHFGGPPLLHLHSALFSAWMGLLIVQAILAARGSIARHRWLGIAGVGLATAMVLVGVLVTLYGVRFGIAAGRSDASKTFAIVPLTILLSFSAAFAAAIASTRRPEVHKRLMLVATIAVMPPAIARLVGLATGVTIASGHPPPIAFSLRPALLSDLLLVAAIVRDWRTRGRPHAAYVVSGLALLAVQLGRVAVGPTPAWHAVVDWLLAFGG